MENQIEIWKEIEGYNGVYFVSNIGNVKSINHYLLGRNGSGKQTGRILKPQKSYKGYLRIALSNNKIIFTTGAHRLVATAFIPNPENKPQVNHINGIKTDNCVENLEWCTNSENQSHAVKNGLCRPNYSEKHHNSKLTNQQVLLVRMLNKNGRTGNSLVREFEVSNVAMNNILRNKTYINL